MPKKKVIKKTPKKSKPNVLRKVLLATVFGLLLLFAIDKGGTLANQSVVNSPLVKLNPVQLNNLKPKAEKVRGVLCRGKLDHETKQATLNFPKAFRAGFITDYIFNCLTKIDRDFELTLVVGANPGGHVIEMVKLIEVLKTYKHVRIFVAGYCASACFILLSHFDDVRVYEHSILMHHDAKHRNKKLNTSLVALSAALNADINVVIHKKIIRSLTKTLGRKIALERSAKFDIVYQEMKHELFLNGETVEYYGFGKSVKTIPVKYIEFSY